MSTQSTTETEPEGLQEFNNTAQKGWNGFTKFLLGNVVVIVVTLLFVGALTVWR
jgi:hypothetical protein